MLGLIKHHTKPPDGGKLSASNLGHFTARELALDIY